MLVAEAALIDVPIARMVLTTHNIDKATLDRVHRNGMYMWRCSECDAIATTESNANPPICGLCETMMTGRGWLKVSFEIEGHKYDAVELDPLKLVK